MTLNFDYYETNSYENEEMKSSDEDFLGKSQQMKKSKLTLMIKLNSQGLRKGSEGITCLPSRLAKTNGRSYVWSHFVGNGYYNCGSRIERP